MNNQKGEIGPIVIIGVLILFIGIFVGGCVSGVGRDYSSGTRVGVVTKLSQKGIIFKSWEGEMLMALPAGMNNVDPEKFQFNVETAAVPKVEAAMRSGHRVELVYRQWWISPVSIDADHVIVDVKDQELK